jgi:hypothetical protein
MGCIKGQVKLCHELLLWPLKIAANWSTASGHKYVGCGVGHARRWMKQREMIQSIRQKADLLRQFPMGGGLYRFTFDVAHSGWDLYEFHSTTRPILTNEHNRGPPLRVEQDWNDSDCSRRTDNVALKHSPVWGNERPRNEIPDVSLMNQLVSKVPEPAHWT